MRSNAFSSEWCADPKVQRADKGVAGLVDDYAHVAVRHQVERALMPMKRGWVRVQELGLFLMALLTLAGGLLSETELLSVMTLIQK